MNSSASLSPAWFLGALLGLTLGLPAALEIIVQGAHPPCWLWSASRSANWGYRSAVAATSLELPHYHLVPAKYFRAIFQRAI